MKKGLHGILFSLMIVFLSTVFGIWYSNVRKTQTRDYGSILGDYGSITFIAGRSQQKHFSDHLSKCTNHCLPDYKQLPPMLFESVPNCCLLRCPTASDAVSAQFTLWFLFSGLILLFTTVQYSLIWGTFSLQLFTPCCFRLWIYESISIDLILWSTVYNPASCAMNIINIYTL